MEQFKVFTGHISDVEKNIASYLEEMNGLGWSVTHMNTVHNGGSFLIIGIIMKEN